MLKGPITQFLCSMQETQVNTLSYIAAFIFYH